MAGSKVAEDSILTGRSREKMMTSERVISARMLFPGGGGGGGGGGATAKGERTIVEPKI